MTDSYTNLLQDISVSRMFAKGETIFHFQQAADSIFKVVTGEVHLFRFNAEGKRVLLYRAFDGQYFAEASLNSDKYHCTAECLKDSTIQIINARKMHSLLEHNPQFAAEWIAILSVELRRQRASVERLNIKSAAERIRHYLLTEGDENGSIKLHGTLSDLSDILGLSRETLYRTMAKMEERGELERGEEMLRLTPELPSG